MRLSCFYYRDFFGLLFFDLGSLCQGPKVFASDLVVSFRAGDLRPCVTKITTYDEDIVLPIMFLSVCYCFYFLVLSLLLQVTENHAGFLCLESIRVFTHG